MPITTDLNNDSAQPEESNQDIHRTVSNETGRGSVETEKTNRSRETE